MTAISSINDPQPQTIENQSGSWWAAFLAGLPHLIMGLLIGVGKLGKLDVYQGSETGTLGTGILLALMVVGILLFAWRQGWPLWSASWYLYGSWITMAVFSLAIENLNLEESWRFSNALFFTWIAVYILGYFLILSKSRLHGLLSVAFLFPLLSLMMLEFIPNHIEGLLAICVGLIAALAAGAIVRRVDFRFGLGLALCFNLAVGSAWAYIGEYKMLDVPPGVPIHVPEFSNFLELLGLYALFGLGVIALPFILQGLWNFGKRKLI